MNKQEFLQALEKGLRSKQVTDVFDIISEYQDYFENQLASGKKESDVAASLGDIESIITDYADIKIGSRKKWFEMVTVSFIALPLLMMNYGVMMVLFAASLSSWGIAVYYTFGLNTLGFMPEIPLLPKLAFILFALASSIFLLSAGMRYFGMLKSMTKQYVVKQTIRIGEYIQSKFVTHMFIISFWAMTGLCVVTYVISALVANHLEFWHEWGWFQS